MVIHWPCLYGLVFCCLSDSENTVVSLCYLVGNASETNSDIDIRLEKDLVPAAPRY